MPIWLTKLKFLSFAHLINKVEQIRIAAEGRAGFLGVYVCLSETNASAEVAVRKLNLISFEVGNVFF